MAPHLRSSPLTDRLFARRGAVMRRGAPPPGYADLALFAGCARRDLVAVGRLGTAISIAPGRVLQRYGASGAALFVVVGGEVCARRGDDLVARIGRGECFGPAVDLDVLLRPDLEVIACAPTDLLVFTRSEYRSLLHDAPALAVGLVAALPRPLPSLRPPVVARAGSDRGGQGQRAGFAGPSTAVLSRG